MLLQVLCIEVTGASYPAQPPEILVLMIGTVTPAERLEGDEVITRMDIRGDVKLSGNLGILRIAHILAIHPQIYIRRDRAEIGNHLFSLPVGRDRHRTTVGADMIVLNGNFRRIILEVSAPGEPHIHILRVTIAVQFPHTRDGHRRPPLLVVVQTVEIRGTLVGTFHPEEMPCAVDRQLVGLGETGVYWVAVDLIHLQVMPLCHRGLLGSGHHGHPCQS